MRKEIEAHNRVFRIYERSEDQMRVRSLGLHDGIIEADRIEDRYLVSVCDSDTVLFCRGLDEAISTVCKQMVLLTPEEGIDHLLRAMDRFHERPN